ncbi:glycoside hydrolase family 17 protein [Gloeophyllum trabeum ATCC 11539]|uniref:glucan endo-1,3-beta-D-glucosidase n=1 Tax=Gloeophyllum trabeum (strain ATCC 11539 / FP-39264 / Madison 617) TaxID=670483 RepID=S7PYQ9_GLOTA|nr:glycoside hydrolase family 17 protein [Gloeophyllum trabeum ATCC 11539]EPQ52588.1 glycoside hydrolase family 17 protein [Gloeophyllum trabeum ATCC 11539]
MSGQPRGYTDLDAPYNAGGNSAWLEKQESRSKRSKWIVIGSFLGLLGLIAIGVALGVTLSRKSSSSSKSSSSGAVNQTDPNDPSTFEKNPNLHQSFYGIAYTPEGSQYPACGNSLDQVITDIQLLSQLTTRIRLYGADCNQSALVLEAIKQTKVNMTVWLANYNIPTDKTPYTRQKQAIQEAIQTYGTDHIGGVTVGNEFMLNYLNANGASDPNSAVGNQGAALLKADIDDTKQMLKDMNVNLQVGNAEAGSYFNTLVLEDVDYGMSNVHPWFANVSIDQAADWTWEFFDEQNVEPAKALSNSPKMYIAETGWPSNSSDAGNESNGPSTASTANLQTFLDTFVCQANQNGTGYFYFEYFDEIWKDQQFGGVEGWWGLFYANRTLKPLTIPDCQSP